MKPTLKTIYKLCCTILFLVSVGCVEEFNFENDTFENLLVVEATLTNEDKFHRIKLSETFPFGEADVTPLEGATVQILATGTVFRFEEIEAGIYQSEINFKAMPNIDYKLSIILNNGKEYQSSIEQLTPASQIDALYVAREESEGGPGASILINSTGAPNQTSYYRYEYTETFKIVAPLWRKDEAYVIDGDPSACEVGLRPRSVDEITCYRTEISNTIPIATTSQLSENTLERFQVIFLPITSYKIGYRYSVLVRQLVQTEQAYNYYETIKRFNNDSGNSSLFSQIQAGYIAGNISSMQSEDEKVVGFFGVSSVQEQRVFFSYRDLFPTEPFPPYIIDCTLSAPKQFSDDPNSCGLLVNFINGLSYLRPNNGEFAPPSGPFVMAPRACGYCTSVGSNEVPDFWVE